MSYILEALRKAERQRRPRAVPGLETVPPGSSARRAPMWALPLVGALLVNAVVLVALQRPDPATRSAPARAPGGSETSVPAPPPPAPAVVRKPPPPPPGAEAGASRPPRPAPPVKPPARPALAPTTPAAPPAPGPATPDAASDVPAAFRAALAQLRVQALVYSDDPQERKVFINGRGFVQGQQVDGGILVEEILEEGVLLSYEGHRHVLRHRR